MNVVLCVVLCFVLHCAVGQTQLYVTASGWAVNLTGTSLPTQCYALATSLLVKDAVCWTPGACAVSGEYQPPLTGTFIGFSAFASVFNSSNLNPTTTLQQLAEAQASICALSYSRLVCDAFFVVAWEGAGDD